MKLQDYLELKQLYTWVPRSIQKGNKIAKQTSNRKIEQHTAIIEDYEVTCGKMPMLKERLTL